MSLDVSLSNRAGFRVGDKVVDLTSSPPLVSYRILKHTPLGRFVMFSTGRGISFYLANLSAFPNSSFIPPTLP
jgi:hypothetical protein